MWQRTGGELEGGLRMSVIKMRCMYRILKRNVPYREKKILALSFELFSNGMKHTEAS